MTIGLNLRLCFQAFLYALIVVTTFDFDVGLGYDRHNDTILCDSSEVVTAYDAESVFATNERRTEVFGDGVTFAKFAGFVAAKGGANLTKAELNKLYPRPTPRRGLADEVWERSKAPTGKVYDPSGVEIKPGDYWELGHRPGNKFSDAQRRAAEQGWDRSTWRQYQNALASGRQPSVLLGINNPGSSTPPPWTTAETDENERQC